MGFFSANCTSCGHPLLSIEATNQINKWMNDAVAIHDNGSVLVGPYDGYGRIAEADYAIAGATVYHKACWLVAGKPLAFDGESQRSEDQGWFFKDPTHDMPEPQLPADSTEAIQAAARIQRGDDTPVTVYRVHR